MLTIYLRPRSWLLFASQTRFDIASGRWRESDHTLTLQPNANWSWALGHRYLQRDTLAGPDSGNNLITSRLYLRFNENWGFRLTHQFEARDGLMEEQYYTLYRDLRSWTTALTFRFRQSRVGPNDFSIAATFSLKAFPRFKLGHDTDTQALLLGS